MKVPKYIIYEVKTGEPIFSDIENGGRCELPIEITDISLEELLRREMEYGKWLFEEYPDGYYHAYCSKCEHWFSEEAYQQKWNYCPHCGARMDGDENG